MSMERRGTLIYYATMHGKPRGIPKVIPDPIRMSITYQIRFNYMPREGRSINSVKRLLVQVTSKARKSS